MPTSSTHHHPLCPPFIKFRVSPAYVLPKKTLIPSELFQCRDVPDTFDISYETQLVETYDRWSKEADSEQRMLTNLEQATLLKKQKGLEKDSVSSSASSSSSSLPLVSSTFSSTSTWSPKKKKEEETGVEKGLKWMDLSEFEQPPDPFDLPPLTNPTTIQGELQQLQTYLPPPPLASVSMPVPSLPPPPPPLPSVPRPPPSSLVSMPVPEMYTTRVSKETSYQKALAMGFSPPAIELAIQLFPTDFKKITEFCILYPTLLHSTCTLFDLTMACPKLGPHESWETFAQRVTLFSHFCEMGFAPPAILTAFLQSDFREDLTLERLGLT